MEKTKFDEEGNFQDLSTEALDERSRGSGGATRGQQIVNQQHTAAGLEGVHVHRDGGSAVLEIVFFFMGLIRKLAFFSNGHEAGLEFDGGSGGKDKTAGINPNDSVHLPGFEIIGQQVYAAGEETGIGQDRGDVLELDAGFGEIGDV